MRSARYRLLVALGLTCALVCLPACFLDSGYNNASLEDLSITDKSFRDTSEGGNGSGYEKNDVPIIARWGGPGETTIVQVNRLSRFDAEHCERTLDSSVGILYSCGGLIYRMYNLATLFIREAEMRANHTFLWCQPPDDRSLEILGHIVDGEPYLEIIDGESREMLPASSFSRVPVDALSIVTHSVSVSTRSRGIGRSMGRVRGTATFESSPDPVSIECWLNLPPQQE